MKWGEDHIRKHDLSSLRLLGSVGEPINPEAWKWYHKVIGGALSYCGYMVADGNWRNHDNHFARSGCFQARICGASIFRSRSQVFNDEGKAARKGRSGKLVLTEPWPSMLRTLYGDNKWYKETYWSEYKGVYFCGDGCRQDKDGYFWIVGRIDDVLNVSGH